MIDALLPTFVLSFGINMAMFLVAFWKKSDKLTDVSYAVTFATIALFAFAGSTHDAGSIILLAMILAWAFRLGGFLLYRVIREGKDGRFDEMRNNFRKFGTFWVGQAVTVWVLMIPVVLAMQSRIDVVTLTIIGLIVWAIGFVVESIADAQKYRFKQDASNKGKWIESGIWHNSRHPNYFGEMLVWIGVYLFVLSSLGDLYAFVSLISPLFIIILLRYVSGIPILEKSADKRWGDNKDYQQYKKRTRLLLPLPK